MMIAASLGSIEIGIKTMRLSGNREEYYTYISCGGREITPNKYSQKYRNRAEYEVAMWRHVLLDEPKPRLMDSRYADPQDRRHLNDSV